MEVSNQLILTSLVPLAVLLGDILFKVENEVVQLLSHFNDVSFSFTHTW